MSQSIFLFFKEKFIYLVFIYNKLYVYFSCLSWQSLDTRPLYIFPAFR